MVASRVGAQLGLLAFALALLAGVWSGNSPVTVLQRGLAALGVGVLVGQLSGWAMQLVLSELQTKQQQSAVHVGHTAGDRAGGDASAE